MSSSASKVLYFTGPHCSVCKPMLPSVEDGAARFAPDVEFVRVDVSADRRTVRLGVASAITAFGVVAAQPIVVVCALGFVAYAFADRLPRFRR
jgi:thiol-disulfide isomerase/thioredoxin